MAILVPLTIYEPVRVPDEEIKMRCALWHWLGCVSSLEPEPNNTAEHEHLLSTVRQLPVHDTMSGDDGKLLPYMVSSDQGVM